MVITILATIYGADNWVDISEFGEAKYDWLSTFLELPNGVPSHDTFGRVFPILDSEKFESYFYAWIQSLEHGRIETRRYTLVSARDPAVFQLCWPGLRGIGMLETPRTVNNEVERSTRYFLTSLAYENIDQFMDAVRKHWNIEINLLFIESSNC